jgi:hypothetical protein
VQLTADGEQHLMLGVDAPDIDGVFVLPLKHVPLIGPRTRNVRFGAQTIAPSPHHGYNL